MRPMLKAEPLTAQQGGLGSYFLQMRMRSEFWFHIAVLAANVSKEFNQLLQIIHREFVALKFERHLHLQAIWTGL